MAAEPRRPLGILAMEEGGVNKGYRVGLAMVASRCGSAGQH